MWRCEVGNLYGPRVRVSFGGGGGGGGGVNLGTVGLPTVRYGRPPTTMPHDGRAMYGTYLSTMYSHPLAPRSGVPHRTVPYRTHLAAQAAPHTNPCIPNHQSDHSASQDRGNRGWVPFHTAQYTQSGPHAPSPHRLRAVAVFTPPDTVAVQTGLLTPVWLHLSASWAVRHICVRATAFQKAPKNAYTSRCRTRASTRTLGNSSKERNCETETPCDGGVLTATGRTDVAVPWRPRSVSHREPYSRSHERFGLRAYTTPEFGQCVRRGNANGIGRYDGLRACADRKEFRVESGEDARAYRACYSTTNRGLESILAVGACSGRDEALDFLVAA
ncbi:hypothetical protein PMIN01_00591 [Paraphaeosphaeria minitans]|uniref:Uncharacterized protein n=1 Tax=Paraphaeosphaeria minitans TaxID=565426 RepID=A0A9P6KW32_9PLEO|nr:hypothetical protein PMIN01_00591 [Paraphaeosphaeria minitans]